MDMIIKLNRFWILVGAGILISIGLIIDITK